MRDIRCPKCDKKFAEEQIALGSIVVKCHRCQETNTYTFGEVDIGEAERPKKKFDLVTS